MARICDFGESKTLHALECSNDAMSAFIGTIVYAAPEIARAPRRYSPESDLFALALVVYECLSLQQVGQPFMERYVQDKDIFDFAHFTEKGGRPSLERLHQEWGENVPAAVERAWAHSPEERGSAALLAGSLQAHVLS